MKFQKLVKTYKTKYPQHGCFDLNPDESINDVVKRYNIPKEYGVYFITAICKNQKEIVYIGKAGWIVSELSSKK
jgi:hypothetical protein